MSPKPDAVEPRTLSGVQIMRGEGVHLAQGFWLEAWSQVVRRPGAIFGLTWLSIVGFFAVFAPLLASGHPLIARELSESGQVIGTNFPLFAQLHAADWLLLIGALLAVPFMLLPLRMARPHRLGLIVASAMQVGMTVVLAYALFAYFKRWTTFDPDMPPPMPAWWLPPALTVVAAILTAAFFLVVPTFRDLWKRIVLVVGIGGVTTMVVISTWNIRLDTYTYREQELAGRLEAVYTLIPWSPAQRPSDRDAKNMPPGSSTDQAMARILVSGLIQGNALGQAEIDRVRSRIDKLPLNEPAKGELRTVIDSQAKPGVTRDELREIAMRALAHGHRHLLGTDNLGQDVLSQLLHAARLAISIGLVSTSIAVLIGVTIGSLMGYFGGIIDLLLYRVVEVFMAVPVLFLLIVAAGVMPRNTYVMMAIIGLFTWTTAARFTRAEFLKLRSQDFVQAARATGLPLRSILFKHILPNGVTPVLVDASFLVAAAILAEATLSFLGLGPPDQASWGRLLSAAVVDVGDFIWWLAIFPGLAIFLTVLSYNLLGECFRDAIDPKLKKAAH